MMAGRRPRGSVGDRVGGEVVGVAAARWCISSCVERRFISLSNECKASKPVCLDTKRPTARPLAKGITKSEGSAAIFGRRPPWHRSEPSPRWKAYSAPSFRHIPRSVSSTMGGGSSSRRARAPRSVHKCPTQNNRTLSVGPRWGPPRGARGRHHKTQIERLAVVANDAADAADSNDTRATLTQHCTDV